MSALSISSIIEREGIRCWIAPRDILYGQDYGAAIVDAISASRVMAATNHAS
jgi:hypothetical protein